jgi:predicted transcriptional regulator
MKTTLEPLLVALEQIEAKGNLLLLANDHSHRVQIMKMMTELGLVEWNAEIKTYELTSYGRECLAKYRETGPSPK